jgi:hypothetical protein
MIDLTSTIEAAFPLFRDFLGNRFGALAEMIGRRLIRFPDVRFAAAAEILESGFRPGPAADLQAVGRQAEEAEERP